MFHYAEMRACMMENCVMRIQHYVVYACPHASAKTSTPLVDRTVDDVLIKTSPLLQQTFLEMFHVTDSRLVDSVLYHPQNLVVNGVEIWAVS